MVQFLAEAMVTASKAGEADVQELPMAVSVLQASDLARTQDRTVEHLASRAPGVTFSQQTGLAQVTIRGIGTNAVFAGSDPSSAVYLDGVYLARPVMVLADFLDLDRVEVLRGPQGTLYGRNSLGGAINLISKMPTNEVETSVQLIAGDQGTLRAQARISGPIKSGRVMGSGAFVRGVRAGTVKDLDHPDDRLGGEDVTAARGQLRVVLTPRSQLLLAADVTHTDPAPLYHAKNLAVKPGFQVNNPSSLHEVRASFPAESRTLQSGASARLTLSLTPAMMLTSLTAFRKVNWNILIDGDISELDLNATHLREDQHQVSEEVTVTSRHSRLEWLAGIFLFRETDHQPASIFARAARLESRLNARVHANANAAFGQVTFAIVPRVSVTGGLRYTNDRKSIDNEGGLYAVDAPGALVSGAYAYNNAISYDAWTPKLGIDVKVRENVLAYVSATRGFKSGGFNFTSPEAGREFAPEWAWSQEGGVKSILGGGRVRLNVAAFVTNYTDLQVQAGIRPGVVDIANAAAATIQGLEIEVETHFTGTTRAGGHIAWLNAQYDQFTAIGFSGTSITTANVAGNRLNNAPEWSGRGWIDWTRPLGRGRSLSLRADATWKTTVFFSPFNDTIQRQSPMGLIDLSAEFGPTHRRWSVGAFARNVTNEDYITGTAPSPPPGIGGRPGDPRQVAVQFALRR